MDNFFGSMYSWLDGLYGLELANYLWGVSSPLSQSNQFIIIGLFMMGISVLLCVLYYYVIDHPRMANWGGWSIYLVVNALINFLVGWQWVLDDYYGNKMVAINPVDGGYVALNIYDADIFCFGVANAILSVLVFVIISLIIKRWSVNGNHSPF